MNLLRFIQNQVNIPQAQTGTKFLRIRGFKGSRIQKLEDSRIQVFKDSSEIIKNYEDLLKKRLKVQVSIFLKMNLEASPQLEYWFDTHHSTIPTIHHSDFSKDYPQKQRSPKKISKLQTLDRSFLNYTRRFLITYWFTMEIWFSIANMPLLRSYGC